MGLTEALLKEMESDIPYYKYYKTNAIRGVISSSCFLSIFVLIAIVKKYRWKDDKNQDGNENENDIDSYTEYELGDEKPFSAFNDVIHLSERHSKFDDNLCKVLNGNGDTETEVGPECTDSSTDNFDNDGFELEEDTDCK